MNNNQMDFFDRLCLAEFFLSLMNFSETITQSQMQEMFEHTVGVLNAHLERQDDKLDVILDKLKALEEKEKEGK